MQVVGYIIGYVVGISARAGCYFVCYFWLLINEWQMTTVNRETVIFISVNERMNVLLSVQVGYAIKEWNGCWSI